MNEIGQNSCNQAPYTVFDQCFERPTDPLFLSLNEIHPHFTQNCEEEEADSEPCLLLDPRTKQVVKKVHYDYSTTGPPEVFRSDTVSTLSKAQHLACLRVLQAWQQQKKAKKKDLIIWHNLSDQRAKEKEMFKEFFSSYVKSNAFSTYSPTNRFVELCRQLYDARKEMLLKQYEDIAYNTHVGLPHVRSAKDDPFVDSVVEIDCVHLVVHQGWVPLLPSYSHEHFAKLNMLLNEFINDFTSSLRRCDNEKVFSEIADKHLEEVASDHGTETSIVYIPLESLLFLFTAGEYLDLPTETMLEITNTRGGCVILKFSDPFPARECGWHTYNALIENALAAYWSRTLESKWLYIKNGTVTAKDATEAPTIDGVPKQRLDYKLISIDFPSNCNKQYPYEIKTNDALIQWQLKNEKEEINFKMLTKLHMPPALDEHATTFLGGSSIKLEYKPQLGAEVMTKYELLKVWIQLRLTKLNSSNRHKAKCIRIAIENLRIQLEEGLTLVSVEKQLLDVYNVKVSSLLAGLFKLLQILTTMPVGKYLLRYNEKFKDNLLLCTPAKEVTQNTIFLHRILQNTPTSLSFIMEGLQLPISDTLCTAVHNYYKRIPCMFRPKMPNEANKSAKKPRVKIMTDEHYVQKTVEKNLMEAKQKKETARKKRNENKKPKRKRRRKETSRKEERGEITDPLQF